MGMAIRSIIRLIRELGRHSLYLTQSLRVTWAGDAGEGDVSGRAAMQRPASRRAGCSRGRCTPRSLGGPLKHSRPRSRGYPRPACATG
jgi:hypothetical protein